MARLNKTKQATCVATGVSLNDSGSLLQSVQGHPGSSEQWAGEASGRSCTVDKLLADAHRLLPASWLRGLVLQPRGSAATVRPPRLPRRRPSFPRPPPRAPSLIFREVEDPPPSLLKTKLKLSSESEGVFFIVGFELFMSFVLVSQWPCAPHWAVRWLQS